MDRKYTKLVKLQMPALKRDIVDEGRDGFEERRVDYLWVFHEGRLSGWEMDFGIELSNPYKSPACCCSNSLHRH